MVKHTQTIRLQQPTNCLSEFDHFVGLELQGLRFTFVRRRLHLIAFLSLTDFPHVLQGVAGVNITYYQTKSFTHNGVRQL